MATMTTQQLFDEAVEKYHLLMTGGSVVEVQDQNGEKVRYSVASASGLLNYISRLAAILDVPNPFAGVAKGPMRFYF